MDGPVANKSFMADASYQLKALRLGLNNILRAEYNFSLMTGKSTKIG
jgi:hypothetical protein